MYCSRCDSYIPSGLDLKYCPNCNVDIINDAIPREKCEPDAVVEEPPAPPPVKKKSLWHLWEKAAALETVPSAPSVPKCPRPLTEYNLFEGLYLGFFSPSFYYDVAKRWQGACICYLTLIVMIATLLFTVFINEKYTGWHDEYLYPVVDKFPSLAFQESKMMMLEKSPYVLDANMGQVGASKRIIFDSAGSVSANNLTSEWLVSPQAVFFKDTAQMLKTVPYNPEMRFKINREILFWAAEQLRRWLPFLVYLIAGSLYWCVLVGSAFLYSLAGILANALLRNGLGYPAIFRLSAIAVTPSALLDSTVYCLFKSDVPWLNTAFFLAPIFYLVLSAVSVRWFINRQVRLEAQATKQQEQTQKRGWYGIRRP